MWRMPKSRFKRGAFLLIVPLAAAFFNRPSNLEICWLVAGQVLLLAYGLSDYFRKDTRNIAAFLLTFSIGCTCIALITWHFWPSMASYLRFSAENPNLGYKDGFEIAGVRWDKDDIELRIVIKSEYEYPMVNVDVTMTPEGHGGHGVFLGMSQTSTVSAVEFHKLPIFPTFPPLIVNGVDGSAADISPMVEDSMRNAFPSVRYRVYCPRLESKEQIKITAIASKGGNPSTAPSGLRITGSYETAPSEGGRRIPIDEEVEIKHP
jgi:hypothetical protein